MSQIEVSHLIDMGMACLGVFFIVVSVGSIFIVLRLRQQNESGAPPPAPPAMTIDPHAVDDKSALPSIDSTPERPIAPAPTPPAPKPAAISPSPAPPAPTRKTYTPIDESDADPTERQVRRTRPAGMTAQPDDATERLMAPPSPPKPTFISPIGLDDPDEDSATIIIDRTKPVDEDEA